MTRPLQARLAAALPESCRTERWMIGVSGGRDSILLLDLLTAHGCRDLLVCHLDHGLREESSEDARFVAEMAAQRGLPFVTERRDVAEKAKAESKSIETAAREARHLFFAETARTHDCPRLFLAHHADDQAETFLFHLFRGASTSGLSGMRTLSRHRIAGIDLSICRPLLAVWREEIDACVAGRGLAYREDASNESGDYTRNRVRHEIIPMMEQILDRGIRRSLWRASEIFREEDELLASLAGEFPQTATLSVPELKAQPVALQRRILLAWLRRAGIPEPGFDDVESVRGLLAGRGAKVNLPGGAHARRREKKLFLEFK